MKIKKLLLLIIFVIFFDLLNVPLSLSHNIELPQCTQPKRIGLFQKSFICLEQSMSLFNSCGISFLRRQKKHFLMQMKYTLKLILLKIMPLKYTRPCPSYFSHLKKNPKICNFIIPKRSLCNNLTISSFYSSQKAQKTHFLANFWQGGHTKVENILISEKNGWNFQES